MKEFCIIGIGCTQNNYSLGNNYKSLQKTIVVLIADFELNGLEKLDFLSSWKIIEEKERKTILTEKFEICIIELPKIANLLQVDGELLDWLFFLENPNSERVIEKMKNNKALREARKKLDMLSSNEKIRRLAELREKAIISENTNLVASYEEGISVGTELGRKEGIKIGQKESIKNTAFALLKENMSIEFIQKITGLSVEDIEKLKENFRH